MATSGNHRVHWGAEKGSQDADPLVTEVEETMEDGMAQQQRPPSRPATAAKAQCPNCGSVELESHESSGATVCTECGVVVEEDAIVSSVEFVEGAGGSSNMVGRFVSASSSRAYTQGASGGSRGGRYGFGRDSRETTLANGRRRIQEVASRLRLGGHFVDSAHRLFSIAVEKNFVQGRRTIHVVAACLYISCRQEKSQHMLIDFSDALQINVYILGACFLKFRRLLGLRLEIVDPALFVYRFAAHLNLSRDANAVALTALRLVGRMKRDWIVAGRKPAGICAAALLIAARAHGFSKNHQDVTKILKVCGMTVAHRVKDFSLTPSAKMTLGEFHSVDLAPEADPPAFSRNRIREARALAIQQGNVELLESGALDDPRAASQVRASQWRSLTAKPKSKKKAELSQIYSQLEVELSGETNQSTDVTVSSSQALVPTPSTEVTTTNDSNTTGISNTVAKGVETTSMQIVPLKGRGATSGNESLRGGAFMYPKGNNGKALVLPDQATAEELSKSTQSSEQKIRLEEWKEDMPEAYSLEMEDILVSDEEFAQKEAIFNRMNADFLSQQQQKESDRQMAIDQAQLDEKHEASQAQGLARYRTKKRGRSDQDPLTGATADNELPSASGDLDAPATDAAAAAPTTEEALLAAVSNRKISRKINYDAMSAIFDDDGSFSTDLLQDSSRNENDESLYEMI